MTDRPNVDCLDLGEAGPAAFRTKLCDCSVLAETIGARLSASSRVSAVVPSSVSIERALETNFGGFTRPYMPHGTDNFDACLIERLARKHTAPRIAAFLSIECWLDRELSQTINRSLSTERYVGDDVVHYTECGPDLMQAFQSVTRSEVCEFTIGIVLPSKSPSLACPPGTQFVRQVWDEVLGTAIAAYASAFDGESWLLAEFS